jgi:hypothetical protein
MSETFAPRAQLETILCSGAGRRRSSFFAIRFARPAESMSHLQR